MKGFLATTIVTLAAASKEVTVDYAHVDVEHQALLANNAVIGQEHVDLVVDDPYSLSGNYNVNDEECMHAIGHDGTYSYINVQPKEGIMHTGDINGHYTESTVMFGGKHLYVNSQKARFMGWNSDSYSWGFTSTEYQKQIVNGGEYGEHWGAFGEAQGEGDKPDTMVNFDITFETDMDAEPEWRCLMRPLLVQAVGYVEQAELSIESKALLEEKRQLVLVHERLVVEAENRKQESLCIEIIEKAMAALEECELAVLRGYVEISDTYPQSWLQLLHEKTVCVDTFSRATASCNHLWSDQWERYYGEYNTATHF